MSRPSAPPLSRREFATVAGSVMAAALTSEIALATSLTNTGLQQQSTHTPPAEAHGSGSLIEAVSQEAASAPAAAIDPQVIEHAEQLAGISFTPAERAMMSRTLPEQLAMLRARRTSPVTPLANNCGGALVFNPLGHGRQPPPASENRIILARGDVPRLPTDEIDIAYAPLTHLSHWIRTGKLSSQRLTRIYLERLKRIGPKLECVITLMEEQALTAARQADVEIAAGDYRGPLHGVPWGAKDILDTKGVATTWGAEPFRGRVPDRDAAVVKRLNDCGAILIAKLSLGALAYDNIWHGGFTRNPWNLVQGSSGSSAGSAAATAAGLVGFALGTETLGSIVSPCMRCGTTGLRPTFGRVPRDGCMALCWSYDKIGPITRTVEDAALVLGAINAIPSHGMAPPSAVAADALADASLIRAGFSYEGNPDLRSMRIGYKPSWFASPSGNALDRQALEAVRDLGAALIELDLPDWPYDTLLTTLFCEAAAAFEELTRSNQDDELKWQEPAAWPNTFRQAWFIPGIELVQADRFRRRVCEMMRDVFATNRLDAVLAPSYAANLLIITNNTGHPSLTIRTGFVPPPLPVGESRGEGSVGRGGGVDGVTPHGITLIGDLFREGPLCALGRALERKFDVWHKRPAVE